MWLTTNATRKTIIAYNLEFIFSTVHNNLIYQAHYSNDITTRISIQTAGLAFSGTVLCSYRVRGVDGSCANHLTVTSYMIRLLIDAGF